MKLWPAALLVLVLGCGHTSEYDVPGSEVRDANSIQGTWKIVSLAGETGEEIEGKEVMKIEGNKATSEGKTLLLDLAADHSRAKLLTDKGEFIAEVTIMLYHDGKHMIWDDRGKHQKALFEKVP